MNEEFEPTLEIGISGMGMSEEDTQKAVQNIQAADIENNIVEPCLLYTSPSPRDLSTSRMPSSA